MIRRPSSVAVAAIGKTFSSYTPPTTVTVNVSNPSSSLAAAAAAAATSASSFSPSYIGGGDGAIRRSFGSGGGTRGSRGHGWFVNYRSGKGGRHLQGEYNHLNLDDMKEWNDAIFSLGSQKAFVDIRAESSVAPIGVAGDSTNNDDNDEGDDDTAHRIELELATTALPLATANFLKLIKARKVDSDVDGNNDAGNNDADGYHGSTLHRIEKNVGVMGGLIARNPYSNPDAPGPVASKDMIGKCHPDYVMDTSFTAMDVSSEHLVLSHVPGIITMMQPKVHEIDSRFMMLSQHAPHMDGISVAIGRVTEESLRTIQKWESTLITSYGIPTNLTLRIVDCGLLDNNEERKNINNNEGTRNDDIEKQKISL